MLKVYDVIRRCSNFNRHKFMDSAWFNDSLILAEVVYWSQFYPYITFPASAP